MDLEAYLETLPAAIQNYTFQLTGSEDDEYGGYIIDCFGIAPDSDGQTPLYLVTRPGETYIVISSRLAECAGHLSDEDISDVLKWGLEEKLSGSAKTVVDLGWPTDESNQPLPWSQLSYKQRQDFARAAERETDSGYYFPPGSEAFYDFLTALFVGTYKTDGYDNLLCGSEGPFSYSWNEFTALT